MRRRRREPRRRERRDAQGLGQHERRQGHRSEPYGRVPESFRRREKGAQDEPGDPDEELRVEERLGRPVCRQGELGQDREAEVGQGSRLRPREHVRELGEDAVDVLEGEAEEDDPPVLFQERELEEGEWW